MGRESIASNNSLSVILSGALFEFDDHTLNQEGHQTLEELLDTVAAKHISGISLGGHTDSTGTVQYNKSLSIRRAQAVADFFVENGVDKSVIEIQGFGENAPVGEDPVQNRRVEVTIVLSDPDI